MNEKAEKSLQLNVPGCISHASVNCAPRFRTDVTKMQAQVYFKHPDSAL